MILKVLIPVLTLILAFPAHAGFKPACKDKDKAAKPAPQPPGPPTAEQAEKVKELLAQTDVKYKQMNKEFRKLMGKPGRKLLRQYVKEMRGQHKKVTKAQRMEFMRTALQNWLNPPNAGAATGVTYDQYLNNNGTVAVIPPGGQDLAANPPANTGTPPAGQGTVGVILPTGGIQ